MIDKIKAVIRNIFRICVYAVITVGFGLTAYSMYKIRAGYEIWGFSILTEPLRIFAVTAIGAVCIFIGETLYALGIFNIKHKYAMPVILLSIVQFIIGILLFQFHLEFFIKIEHFAFFVELLTSITDEITGISMCISSAMLWIIVFIRLIGALIRKIKAKHELRYGTKSGIPKKEKG